MNPRAFLAAGLGVLAGTVPGCSASLSGSLLGLLAPAQRAGQVASEAEATGSVSDFEPLEEGPFVEEVARGAPYRASNPGGAVIFSPDGKRFAYSLQSGNEPPILHVGDVGGATRSFAFRPEGDLWWSPDSRRLAGAEVLNRDDRTFALRTVDLQSGAIGEPRSTFVAIQPWVGWYSGGTLFLDEHFTPGTGFREIGLWKVPDGSTSPTRLASVADVHMARLGMRPIYPSPDGRQVALLTGIPGYMEAAALTLVDLESGTPRTIRRVAKGTPELVWDPAGAYLGYLTGSINGDYELHRVQLSDGSDEVTPFFLGPPEVIAIPGGTAVTGYFATHPSPDLEWCIVGRGDSPLFARDLATGRHTQLTTGKGQVLTWTADSRHIFVRVLGQREGESRYYKVQVKR